MTGLDVARAVAMLGMVIAHYAVPDGSGSVVDRLVTATNGRAMPLFVLLGGVGATILANRSTNPDRTLLIRAAVLYPAGLLLQEATLFIIIILQYYALFFALATLLRRLPTAALVAMAVVTGLAGGWTDQLLVDELPDFDGPSQYLTDPVGAIVGQVTELLVNGHYPFVPVGAFFITGMIIGRLDLRNQKLSAGLAAAGATIGVIAVVGGRAVLDAASPADRQNALERAGDAGFQWLSLFDTTGHSAMPAWVVSAAATSVAVVGGSLLLAQVLGRLGPTLLKPLIAVGRMALTFYVVQALLIHLAPHPLTTSTAQGLVTAIVIYLGFVPVAMLWLQWFDHGPLEWLLRTVAPTRRPDRMVNRPGGPTADGPGPA